MLFQWPFCAAESKRLGGENRYVGGAMAAKAKKVAAALAAVNLYLQQEQEALEQQENERQPMQYSSWGQSGRQDIMNMRRMIQMRLFTR